MKVKLLRSHSKDCRVSGIEPKWWGLGHRFLSGDMPGRIRLDALGRKNNGTWYIWLTAGCNDSRCNALLGIREDSILEAAQKILEGK